MGTGFPFGVVEIELAGAEGDSTTARERQHRELRTAPKATAQSSCEHRGTLPSPCPSAPQISEGSPRPPGQLPSSSCHCVNQMDN